MCDYISQHTTAPFSVLCAVCDFLLVYEISREPLNGFAPKWQGRRVWFVARMNLNVKIKGQRLRSPGTKTGVFSGYHGNRRTDLRRIWNSHGRCVWCLVPTSLKVRVKGQRSRSPRTKTGFSGGYLGNNGFARNSRGRRVRSLARTSLKVKIKGHMSRSPGTKTACFDPFSSLRAVYVWHKTSKSASEYINYRRLVLREMLPVIRNRNMWQVTCSLRAPTLLQRHVDLRVWS